MSKKKTDKEFKDEIFNIFGDSILILEPYTGNKNKILVRFLECNHEEYKIPSKLLIGRGCSKCSGKKISQSKMKKQESICEELIEKGVELLGEYSGSNKKVKVKNLKCNHIYAALPYNILNGSGCPICHGFKDTHMFKTEIKDLYGDEYTVLGEYVNNRTKILARHNVCGHEWETIPKDLIRDRRCPICISSKGELYIKSLLDNLNIKYVQQYRIKECRNKLPLPFDFMIETNNGIKLIEFDGSQHFNKSNKWGKKDNSIQINDAIKNDYCKNHNIELLRVPYWWLRTDKIKTEIINFINS